MQRKDDQTVGFSVSRAVARRSRSRGAISPDGTQVLMETLDGEGKPRLWLAPFDRRSPPRLIPGVEGRSANFSASGEIFFRHTEGASGYLYRVRPDGTGLRKALEQPVFYLNRFSPDGRWIEAWAPHAGIQGAIVQMFPLDGGSPIVIGATLICSGRAAETRYGSQPGQFPMAGPISFHCRLQRCCHRYLRVDFVPSRKLPACLVRA